MAEEQIPAEQTWKSEWVKPEVSLVEAGDAESTPGAGGDGYASYS